MSDFDANKVTSLLSAGGVIFLNSYVELLDEALNHARMESDGINTFNSMIAENPKHLAEEFFSKD